MINWSDSQTLAQTLATDSNSTTLTFLKMMMNFGYKYILSELNRSVTEKTRVGQTVANQQYYQGPQDLLFPVSIKVTVGTSVYPVEIIESQERWDKLNIWPQSSAIPQFAFISQRFGIAGTTIGIWPTPSTADQTITLIYEPTAKDLSVDNYVTGNVTVTNGSATVIGSGTTFTSAMIGRYFKNESVNSDGMLYKIIARVSNTEITLENYYDGSTESGASYSISEAFNLPEEMQMLPIYYALFTYFSSKQNATESAKYFTLYEDGMKKAKKRWAKKSTSSSVNQNLRIPSGTYPYWFPQTFS